MTREEAEKKLGTPPSNCPSCGKVNDLAECLEDESARPKPGDVSICIKCGAFLIFNSSLGQDLMSEDALSDLRKNHYEAFAALWKIKKAIIRQIQTNDEWCENGKRI